MACLALIALGGCNVTGAGADGFLSRPASRPGFGRRRVLDENAAREMISLYRKKNGLSEVACDPTLQKAAQFQAKAMAEAGRLDHNVKGPLRKKDRRGAGRGKGYAVENVSAGYKSFEEAVAGWRRSKLHNENLLEPHMRRMGIATAYAPDAHTRFFGR